MSTGTWAGSAWSCTVRLVVADRQVLTPAVEDLTALLARVDAAVSRFRPDSELAVANARAGRPTPVSKLTVSLVAAALDAARTTGGAVDPTLGRTISALGYDRDIAQLRAGHVGTPAETRVRRDAWQAVRLHRDLGLLTVPAGTALDLGATAKAWTADRAAHTLAARYDTAVLVELGGDLAVAGDRPEGWCIQVAEREGGDGQLLLVHRGGVTTSTTTVRHWQQDGADRHHIVDPRTGRPADGPWRTATVAAPSALEANVASTAAIVLGADAPAWLERQGLVARLVDRTGAVTTTPGWPDPAATDLAA